MPSRRRFLGFVAGGTLPVAGCLSTPNDASETTIEQSTASTTTEREPVRGGAAEVSVERTITDEEYQYVESNDTVRYPATMAGDEVAEYDYLPFDEWGHFEGASVAAEYVRPLLDERLPDAEAVNVAVSTRGDQEGNQLRVSLRTHLARDGDVISEPSVSRSEVVEATPHTVDAMIHFAERTYTDTYPVYVEERTVQNA